MPKKKKTKTKTKNKIKITSTTHTQKLVANFARSSYSGDKISHHMRCMTEI